MKRVEHSIRFVSDDNFYTTDIVKTVDGLALTFIRNAKGNRFIEGADRKSIESLRDFLSELLPELEAVERGGIRGVDITENNTEKTP